MHRLEKITLSIKAQNHLGQIKHKTGIPINVLARFAIGLSLRDDSMPNPDMYDETGMDLLPHILYGKNEPVYAALFRHRLAKDGLDYEQYGERMIRAHVNRGSTILFTRVDALEDFAKIVDGGQS